MHLRLTGIFLDKANSNINFTDEALVRCDFQLQNTFLDVGDIQIITNKFWLARCVRKPKVTGSSPAASHVQR